ncbi:MAG TPA: mismatch-specific DNA-glycosylase [Dehalococcoidia bacterium]|nr:mismatch-specific DNA-glycosylase [Dehalococcoidia bacterium]|tara:strand:+ start:163 stop:729 length:567 start_codon:yes stop_codon:yes gene_type:complete
MTVNIQTLPRYLRPGLGFVFIGYNPSIYSAKEGHYYARASNVFWKQLNASGLLTQPAGPEDDATLMDEAGIGFIDLCPRPTVQANELTDMEIAQGSKYLLRKLEEHQPTYAIFNGRGVYSLFAQHALGQLPTKSKGHLNGIQPVRIGNTIPYVVPSSSGLACRWQHERLALLKKLAKLVNPPSAPLRS